MARLGLSYVIFMIYRTMSEWDLYCWTYVSYRTSHSGGLGRTVAVGDLDYLSGISDISDTSRVCNSMR